MTISKQPQTLYATDDLGGGTYAFEQLSEITEEMQVFEDSNNENFDATDYSYEEVTLGDDGYYRDSKGQAYEWNAESKYLKFLLGV